MIPNGCEHHAGSVKRHSSVGSRRHGLGTTFCQGAVSLRMSQENTDATTLSASGRALSPSALSLSASVGEAYTTCLSVEGGFLPPKVPAQELPPPFDLYTRACLELATHYHAGDAHVRPWLDECMTWKEDWAGMVDELDEPELNSLMTALSTLAHAYRWDSAPPRSEEYRRSRIDLPPA